MLILTRNLFKVVAPFALLASSLLSAEEILIQNTSGKSIQAEVVSRDGDKVTIKRNKDGRSFTIPLSSLNADSKKKVLKELERLANSYPKLEADIVIGKRRNYSNGSYYMKKMDITSKTTIKNTDLNRGCPPCDCHIILVGQDQREEDLFSVLSNQKFELTPNHKGAEFEAKPVFTKYDSDNKGTGNIGGYKYVGYLLVVMDKESSVILTKTNYSKIEKAIELDSSRIKKFCDYEADQKLDSRMDEYEGY
ncbi:hypothetical protein SAMN02745181_3734 [Rubritalea squalenifaciens DSM 18772]|uniref:Uncharacterized protein n=1 Tax=Rubritalea squalenifaciens DSM 18772 TaxID=1123071 RepID=A0A1M6S6K1_9BACT|nr:hypothetical protein [Rubritalea squalenifaciens]SHK40326.1 hypothetical protein SAMN02745181_3734 [Rubritalea squalenifaciens DSM 18772]